MTSPHALVPAGNGALQRVAVLAGALILLVVGEVLLL